MSDKVKERKYSKEFKLEAVKLIQESGSVSRTSKDLGVSPQALYSWIAQYKQHDSAAFPGKGKLRPEDEELRQLRREVQRLKETNEILKKAASYFATQMK